MATLKPPSLPSTAGFPGSGLQFPPSLTRIQKDPYCPPNHLQISTGSIISVDPTLHTARILDLSVQPNPSGQQGPKSNPLLGLISSKCSKRKFRQTQCYKIHPPSIGEDGTQGLFTPNRALPLSHTSTHHQTSTKFTS